MGSITPQAHSNPQFPSFIAKMIPNFRALWA
jgi:hypothetical protein